jgi:putative oxidoreductase
VEIADLPARLALGGAMLYHGLTKILGEGPREHGATFESLGFRPGRRWALATGLAETFAGAAAILGIATRPAALAVLVTQGVAIWKVHRPKGYSVMQGGMEYNLSLVATAAGLLLEGPRKVSALHALRRSRQPSWARALPVGVRSGVVDRALELIH